MANLLANNFPIAYKSSSYKAAIALIWNLKKSCLTRCERFYLVPLQVGGIIHHCCEYKWRSTLPTDSGTYVRLLTSWRKRSRQPPKLMNHVDWQGRVMILDFTQIWRHSLLWHRRWKAERQSWGELYESRMIILRGFIISSDRCLSCGSACVSFPNRISAINLVSVIFFNIYITNGNDV